MVGEERGCPRCGRTFGAGVDFCPKDGSPLDPALAADPWRGRVLGDQVEVQELIGVGAMGRVYRGYQRGVEREVAIKVLRDELLESPSATERFHREARVASRISHPHVVQVYLSGEVSLTSERETHTTERVCTYVVMEYVRGQSLRSLLGNEGGALPLDRTLRIGLQICDAVGEAHAQGVVHRDLKPENIMLTERTADQDFVKVLDFGVARLEGLDGAQTTQAGTVFGTARYMSPEGACGETVTPRSDVYSLATVLYECLTGATPFDGENTVAILVKQRVDPVPSLVKRAQVPVPVAIAEVIERGLAKAPDDRFYNARDFGDALRHATTETGDRVEVRETFDARPARGVAPTLLEDGTPRSARSDDRGRQMHPSSDEDRARNEEPLVAEDPSPGEMPFPEEVARTQLTPPSGLPFHTATDESPGTEVRAQTAVPGAVTRGQTRPQQRLRGPAWVWASATVLALAVLAAGWFLHDRQLGEPATVTEFVALAEAAMAEDHWRADDGSGFVEITDEALRRFPGAPAIVELRNSASQRLLRRARDLQDTAPLEGARYAALARELASGAITNAASDSRSSSGEEDVSVVPSPEPVEDPFPSTRTTSSPAATGSAPAEEAVTPKSSRPATRTTPVPRTTPLPPPKPRPMPAPDNTSEPLDSFDTPPASTGGRWL